MKKTTQDMNTKKKARNNSLRRGRCWWLRQMTLLAALLLPMGVWAQTDYSGTYYIKSASVKKKTAGDYYICPTEGWIYYEATNTFTENPNGQPFLTTYQCRSTVSYDSTKAIWKIEKRGDYYTIKHVKDGKYMVFNGQISNANVNRIRVHLDSADVATPGDSVLFVIGTNNDGNIVISPKGASTNYFNACQGNINSLAGSTLYNDKAKNDGPTTPTNHKNDIHGTIGLWSDKNDPNAPFLLEECVTRPTIDQAANGNVTITCATGNTTIYYTLNGDDPVVPADGTTDPTDPNTYKYSTSFSPAIGSTGVKAVAVLNVMHAVASKTAELSFAAYTTPTITFNNTTNEASISSDGTVYYTTDGSDPIVGSSSTYSTPLTITSAKTVKAIAVHTGYLASDMGSLTIDKVATPVITPLTDGTVEITCTTPEATIRYEMGANPSAPTTSSTAYTGPIVGAAGKTIKVIAVKEGWINSDLATSEIEFTCATPVIRKTSATTFTIECNFPTSGVTIRYTKGTAPAAPTASSGEVYSGPVTFGIGELPFTVKAIAVATDYNNSEVAEKLFTESLIEDADGYYGIASASDYAKFIDMVNSDGAGYRYKITADITLSGPDEIVAPFTGELKGVAKADGTLPVVSGMNHAIFRSIDGGTVKNVILDNVSISSGSNVGAICNEATGDSRIYNCGVLATGSTVTTDEDGYTQITTCSSTIRGSNNVGGLVGLLGGSSRVINCFSYANITGGNYVGGIVGYNNVATTASNLQTMVMNCMFYGEVSGTSIAPIYNGAIITNDGDADGVNNFNYFRLESAYIQNTDITKVYNCALGAETRFLQRFEFFRHLLNSNRELAAWWASTSTTAVAKDEMMKWVMEPTQIGTATPYPILKTPAKYASVVNYTPSNIAYDSTEANRNKGRKLTSEGDGGVLHVTIQMGNATKFSVPQGAGFKPGVTGQLDLIITDKDFEHFNFNYGKVQLPYYNDYCEGNYTGNRVVTGWKITSITGGTAGSYSTGDDVTYTNGELTATPYNFADRKCKNKDLYSVSGRVFNQGAYWDVPEGVTAITIQPYWGKAVYLSDAYWDVVYQNGTGNGTGAGTAYDAMTTAADVTTVGGGQRYNNGVSTFNGQVVYTSMSSAIASTALFSESVTNPTVYDYAVVLVGNYHHTASIEANKNYTVTSVDQDGDNEPDYSFMLRFNSRLAFHPVRYDFLNLMGLGMAQKTTGGKGSYNLGIMQPKAWFEVTNTALFRVTQFEYSKSRTKSPYILQGGVIEQWVTQQDNAGDGVSYFHIGGNVWFKEFHRGSHQDNKDKSTPHPPVSVTGGDYAKFYLTGYYQSQAAIYDDNAECYINGGRFGEVAGAGMEGIGTSDGKGNITWVIDNADITEFYGGGINYDKPVHGNIHTIISNSHVDIFCGGPKFGDMSSGKTVTTTATGCTFGTFFGAGYGGNSYSRQAPRNHNNIVNFPHNDQQAGNHSSWNDWLAAYYDQSYNSTYGGVSTQFDYQFLPMSSNTENVARIFVEYVGFSLATTHNVTSSLTDCTVTGNFYGGGSLGKVVGNVISILDSCVVKGNAFGAGFSASRPDVTVDAIGFETEPYYYEDLGTYRVGVKYKENSNYQPTIYTWENDDAISIDKTDHILYTTEDLSETNLGSVEGNAILTLQGTTRVDGNVYGGGDQSVVKGADKGNTTVILRGKANVIGNVYGGGNKGQVSGNSEVKIQD